jgi:transcriptional regulator with XRE-family HTH domain
MIGTHNTGLPTRQDLAIVPEGRNKIMAPKRETALERWGKEFALARDAAGYTQESLAEAAHVSRSVIAKWENGTRPPKDLKDLERCEEKLGTRGYLKRLLKEWVEREINPEWSEWMDVEDRSTELSTVEMVVIPGLLQTENFARVVLPTDNLIHQRMERQEVLTKDSPPFFEALLSESLLYNRVGNESIMVEQLRHLIEMAQQENIVIRVIPFSSSVCARFAGSFVLASLDVGGHAAYADGEIKGRILERPKDLSKLRRKWARFSAEALPPKESIELIQKVLKERWGDIT